MSQPVDDTGPAPLLYRGDTGDSESHAELRAHFESYFERAGQELTWPGAQVARVLPGFRVLEIPPNDETPRWTYASIGAFVVAPPGGVPVEFLLSTETQTRRGVELVTMVAHYHFHHPLGLGQMLPIGGPWMPGSTCDALLIAQLHPFGPSLGRAPLALAGEAQVWWLLPITPAERRFAKVHGVDALEAEFDRVELSYWVAARASVVA